MRCKEFGTARACGNCKVDITSASGVEGVSALTMAMIGKTMIHYPSEDNFIIDVYKSEAKCNGEIVIRGRYAKSEEHPNYTNSLRYCEYLDNWLSSKRHASQQIEDGPNAHGWVEEYLLGVSNAAWTDFREAQRLARELVETLEEDEKERRQVVVAKSRS
jgi:hypothetical protein